MPQAQLSDADKDRQQLRTRVHRQSEDIEQLRSQCRAIQNNYDHQVVEHAGAVNKLNAVEVALKAASEKVRQQQDIVTQAQRQKVLFLIATAMFSCSQVCSNAASLEIATVQLWHSGYEPFHPNHVHCRRMLRQS